MADSVDSILSGKYPAKAHAKRVADYMKAHGGSGSGVIYLEGQKTRMIEDNDEAMPFRQRRYFYYLTGCPLPDCYFTYDIEAQTSTLFIPPVDPDEVVWSGLPTTVEEARERYDVDDVRLSTEVNLYLTSSSTPQSTVWAINHQVSTHTTFLSFASKDFSLAKTAIEECRVVKDAYEIALTKKANAISTTAHIAVMKAVKHASNERELQALFLQQCIAHGCREQAYGAIVASGTNAATLHYQQNSLPLAGKLNLLLDAGGEYRCYASDITRTFPVNGRFTRESRAIYAIVLKMQKACIAMLRAGVVWERVHERAHQLAIEGLLHLGLLRGDKEALFAARTSVAFFPHGLGHYLGMDTHDSGGHADYADPDPMFRYLRVRGALPAGAIVTVEPGLYFCRFIVEPYLRDEKHAGFIDEDVLERYWSVGGVRIEDDLLVTEEGSENLTATPKEVEDVEALVNG
ncbi:putative Xaa-Pro aminopeptidase pepP [Cryomyces minteri]|uniref:Xaa-Pro aminopeptidase n=1 Tax=Cryomyces minteri TaxID=331657 RepID=A0A4U0XVK6_9PEZI|nr:putative Xaa-Pro aminopeptidase pepP [Cryomyces minteri]